MKVVYALQQFESSIFLAGPTPRSNDVPSWRPEALRYLEAAGFKGSVFVPETADWLTHNNYDTQIEWEWAGINMSTVVVFWVPRDMETMPGFTTNVEFGFVCHTGKCVLGAPRGAPKMGYLRALANRYNVPQAKTLEKTLDMAMALAERPFRLNPIPQIVDIRGSVSNE